MPKPKRKNTSQRNQAKDNQLRIIGGQWRGRKLSFPDAEGLRPTGDRIRETLFNWLSYDLPGARCADLFAGSGALGLEALSRGAAHNTFIEFDTGAAKQLEQNLNQLACTDATVRYGDTLQWLQHTPEHPLDIVFIDPPFQLDLWDQVIELLTEQKWLNPEAAIYIETPRQHPPLNIPNNWQLHREKQAGDVHYRLYYFQP